MQILQNYWRNESKVTRKMWSWTGYFAIKDTIGKTGKTWGGSAY